MINSSLVIIVSLTYIGVLFAIASYGDKLAIKKPVRQTTGKPLIYALTLAVYCTSWTFYGSVGLAASSGYDFLPVYIGPILLFTLGYPIILKVIRIAKAENITTIADFVAARFGKNQALSAIATLTVVLGILPYIALQLKAVSASFNVLTHNLNSQIPEATSIGNWWSDTALIVAALMIIFSIIFGTRNINATEHHHGMMLAIAFESIIKLLAFTAVGIFVTFFMFGGIGELISSAAAAPIIVERFTGGIDAPKWITITLLSMAAIICLPRQFHVAVVENSSEGDLKKAAWIFPLYLIAINLFVIPIALAGLLAFDGSALDADTFVLALPMLKQQETLALLVFIGGLSAATGMVIVATVALSTMVSNDVVMPLFIRFGPNGIGKRGDAGKLVLRVRRASIFFIIILAFAYYRIAGEGQALASIGLISFAAVAQLAPSIFGAIFWQKASRLGALSGVLLGFFIWAYTLLLPTFSENTWLPIEFITEGPWKLGFLAPHALFGIPFSDPLTHGVVWSIGANILAFVLISLVTKHSEIERLQAQAFVHIDTSYSVNKTQNLSATLTVNDIQNIAIGYLGADAVKRAYNEYAANRFLELDPMAKVDAGLLRYTERLLAAAIGASSARLVMALSLERDDMNMKSALSLLDDASDAIRYNRELLQSTMENVSQGIAVFDEKLRLLWWNQQFVDYLSLPREYARSGVTVENLVRYSAEHGEYGAVDSDKIITEMMDAHRSLTPITYERTLPNGTILEGRTTATPGGNIVITFTDVTERVTTTVELAEAKEGLELRVIERTQALTQLNKQLREATLAAENANLGKTHFLAAASHDLLQPLNAARLFLSSMSERPQSFDNAKIIERVETSLKSVENLLEELLDISKLDAGGFVTQIEDFAINDLLSELTLQFAALAKERNINVSYIPSQRFVKSDVRLLRRILQNFLSNAIRYTPNKGRVVMGCRLNGDLLRIEVWDTGQGIPDEKQKIIFGEFQQLSNTENISTGLGLGLAIVDRISQLLNHQITLKSQVNKGSMFAISVPIGEAVFDLTVKTKTPDPISNKLTDAIILCIDDDKNILDAMTELLSIWQCDVRTATNNKDWRDALNGTAPDIILADIHLGKSINGLNVVEEILLSFGRPIPAIIISADQNEKLILEVSHKGYSILPKPVKPAALRALMTRLLTTSKQHVN